jgi:hypothetical protein
LPIFHSCACIDAKAGEQPHLPLSSKKLSFDFLGQEEQLLFFLRENAIGLRFDALIEKRRLYVQVQEKTNTAPYNSSQKT